MKDIRSINRPFIDSAPSIVENMVDAKHKKNPKRDG